MSDLTREEFEAFKQEIRQEVKQQIREQRTDEMKAINVNVASADVLNQLKTLEEGQQGIAQKQDKFSADVGELKIDAKAYTGDAAIFKNKVEGVESDVSMIKTDIEEVKTVLKGHAKFFEVQGKRLAAMATKDDITRLESDITSMKTTQEQILKLLQQKQGE